MAVRSAFILDAVMERISLISCCGVVIFATVMVCEISDAAPDPTSQNVRSAIERSLPYIEKVGTAWMQERKCNSCHNVTFLVWTYNEAAARGFENPLDARSVAVVQSEKYLQIGSNGTA